MSSSEEARQRRFYGLIPARAGSTGIPRKNVQPVCGKPLIAYSIESALGSSLLARTIVSTDDEEIAQVARSLGAEVPFVRPAELATPEARSVDVVIHALDWLKQNDGFEPDCIVLLQPTSPLRTARHIDEAIRLCLERNADSVVSVCEARNHPYRLKVLDSDGRVRPFMEVDLRRYHRRQDLPTVFATNGAVYLVRSPVIRERQSFFTQRTYAYVMDVSESIDVDTPWDLMVAEMALQRREGRE